MLTAIELGAKSVSAVQAHANGQGLEISKSGSADIAAVDPDSLRTALAKCGVSGGRAILLIQRGQAILREFELPAGTPDELVSMVRFQVEREMPLPPDQIRYSYIETGRTADKVRVQVAAVPRDILDQAIGAVEAAGVKVSNVFVSSFGLLALYPEGEPAALLEVAGGEAEILIVDHGSILLSRTVALVDGFEIDKVVEEVERTLLSFSAKGSGKEIRKVVLAGEGPAASELAGALRSRLSREVVSAGPGDLETAAAAGICLGVSRSRAMPDLLNPPVAVKKFRFTKVHRLVALSAAILAMIVVWSQLLLSDKRKELEQKRNDLKSLEPAAAQISKLEGQTLLAHQWYGTRNVWVPVFAALQKNVNTNSIWITTALFDENGVIRLNGKARDDQQIHDLDKALKKTDLFQDINLDQLHNSTDKSSEYKRDFVLTAHLKGYNIPRKRGTS
jgi:Tfp pilus assembly PilM family ATPase